MAFLEQDIETVIVTALDAVVSVPVYGMTVPSETREKTYVCVKANPRVKRSTQSPITDIEIEITCAAHKDDCNNADYLTEIMGEVVNQIEDWETDLDTACDALTIDTFRVDGFKNNGGQSPAYDGTNTTWFCIYNLTLSGVIQIPVEE